MIELNKLNKPYKSNNRQKLVVVTGITIFCLGLVDCLVGQVQLMHPVYASDETRPRISIDKNSFDFGKVVEGESVSHTFTVTNRGSGLLKMRVSASCGCTTPKLSRDTLTPGESAALDITVDTAMKQDAVTKDVSIESNDALQPQLKISLLMLVQDPHRGMSDTTGRKIFDDAHCASCHVARGSGKFGRSACA